MCKIRKTVYGIMLGFGLLGNVSLAGDTAVRIPWLEDNLVPNADFEEMAAGNPLPQGWTVQITPDKGATATADTAVFLKGRQSLRLDVPKSMADNKPAVVVSSAAIPVAPEALYLVSFAFRQEGFNSTGEPNHYEGVTANPHLEWLDEKQNSVGRSAILSQFPYGPCRWDLRDAFEPAPANARFAQIVVSVTNGALSHGGKNVPATLWLDTIQLRRYLPPATPEWAKGETARIVDGGMVADQRMQSYFVGCDDAFSNMRGGSWSRIVPDPQAERGMALQAQTGAGRGYLTHSPYFNALPAGLYRLRARVKLPLAKEPGAVGFVDINSQNAAMRQILPFVPTPDTAGKYTVFEADFVLRDASWWSLRVVTYGKEVWSIDSLKVVPLHEFEDRQLLAVYPGCEGEIPADLKPPAYKVVTVGPFPPMYGLAVAGFGYDRYKIPETFHLLYIDGRMKAVWVRKGMGGMSFTGFPEEPRELFQYAIIYLCNVNLRSMALKYKNALYEYVKRGGALVVLGGHQAYERGGWGGSLLEEAMPVTVAPNLIGGMHYWPQGEELTVDHAAAPWLEAISTAAKPRVYYAHKVTVKPGGLVLVRAGKEPFLVAGTYGAGRVICVLGVAWGEPGPGETPFWAWNDWIDLFRETCFWALQVPAVVPEEP